MLNLYILQILDSLNQRMVAIMSSSNLKTNCHKEDFRLEVISLLDALCGVAEATRVDCVQLLFNFIYPQIVRCTTLLGKLAISFVGELFIS